MRGTPSTPFNTLFADTCNTHGIEWAQAYYLKRGMAPWEFAVWLAGFKASQ